MTFQIVADSFHYSSLVARMIVYINYYYLFFLHTFSLTHHIKHKLLLLLLLFKIRFLELLGVIWEMISEWEESGGERGGWEREEEKEGSLWREREEMGRKEVVGSTSLLYLLILIYSFLQLKTLFLLCLIYYIYNVDFCQIIWGKKRRRRTTMQC